MPLSRRLLSAGTLAASLLAGCAGAPPPASAPPTGSRAGQLTVAELVSIVNQGSSAGHVSGREIPSTRGDCDPNDPMAFDPGPRADSLAILHVPGGWVAPMPNACPVDARFQLQQPSRYVTVRIRPAPKPR